MKNIIREVDGCEVTFHHNSYYKVNGWLECQNIAHDQFNIIIDPHSYQPITCSIRFHDEKDLTLFLLRWT